jgi:6-phosphogluconolactonase
LTLPEGEDNIKWASAIRISKDGMFLYTGQRGHDSISVFRIDEKGKLKRIQTISSFGKHPRDFALSPDNRFLVCANLDSDNLTLYERNGETGMLTLVQKDVFAPETVCVVFDKDN